MALFRPIHGDMSGPVGDNVWSHNKAGPYIRRRAIPTNPNTSRQQAIRSAFATQSSTWATLTQAQRDAWNAYAELNTVKNRLGEDITISGIAWFVKVNTLLDDAALPEVTDPPSLTAPGALDSINVGFPSDTTVSLIFATLTLTASKVIQLWYTLANSLGSTPNFNQARMIGYSATAVQSPVQYTLPFGVVSNLQSTFFARVVRNDGLASGYLQETQTR